MSLEMAKISEPNLVTAHDSTVSEGEKLVTADAAGVDERNCGTDEIDSMEAGAGPCDDNNGCGCHIIEKIQTAISNFIKSHKRVLKLILLIIGLIVYSAYLIWACVLDWRRALPLIVFTSLAIVYLIIRVVTGRCSQRFLEGVWNPVKIKIHPKRNIIKGISVAAIVLMVLVSVSVIIGNRYQQYQGLAGLIFLTFCLFVTSNNPAKVSWRPVLVGMLINYIFAVLILKTTGGQLFFEWLSNGISGFLKFTDEGSKFVFGRVEYEYHIFAFKVLPTIVFFSCVISLLYYIGVMQYIIGKIALVMTVTMGTSPVESLSCAGNIFVGQTEAPILVRPFLALMTKSELHAVMTGGFATIAGGVLAAYIGFGVPAQHLLCASVMSAPMALAMSKLFYPETEKPGYIDNGSHIQFEKLQEQNFIEAAAAGASQSIGLVANIAANIIAFLALLAFVNSVLGYVGSLVDLPDLSFELICSYLFMPLALMMGVQWKDSGLVAELIGTKIFLNEFVAYQKLGKFIDARKTCDDSRPSMSPQSEIIATYALCGFANLSSIGIQLGGIGAMAPSRRQDLANLVVRALIAGSVATLMTACLAGMLVDHDSVTGNCILPNVTTEAPPTLASCCTDYCTYIGKNLTVSNNTGI